MSLSVAVESNVFENSVAGAIPPIFSQPVALFETRTPIGVFWDIENCGVPSRKSAVIVVARIRERFFTGRKEAEFVCVCDINKQKKNLIQDLNNAQVTVVHVDGISKNASDDKIRQMLHRFADDHPPPATVVLISGDINFAPELSDLRYRHHMYIIVIHPTNASYALLSCAHERCCFQELVADLPERQIAYQADLDHSRRSLVISNIPLNGLNRVARRLEQLSKNCGGKIIQLKDGLAMILFPNVVSTSRAKQRMDGEDVYGHKINVRHLWECDGRTQNDEVDDRQEDVNLGGQRNSGLDKDQASDSDREALRGVCSEQLRRNWVDMEGVYPLHVFNTVKSDGDFGRGRSVTPTDVEFFSDGSNGGKIRANRGCQILNKCDVRRSVKKLGDSLQDCGNDSGQVVMSQGKILFDELHGDGDDENDDVKVMQNDAEKEGEQKASDDVLKAKSASGKPRKKKNKRLLKSKNATLKSPEYAVVTCSPCPGSPDQKTKTISDPRKHLEDSVEDIECSCDAIPQLINFDQSNDCIHIAELVKIEKAVVLHNSVIESLSDSSNSVYPLTLPALDELITVANTSEDSNVVRTLPKINDSTKANMVDTVQDHSDTAAPRKVFSFSDLVSSFQAANGLTISVASEVMSGFSRNCPSASGVGDSSMRNYYHHYPLHHLHHSTSMIVGSDQFSMMPLPTSSSYSSLEGSTPQLCYNSGTHITPSIVHADNAAGNTSLFCSRPLGLPKDAENIVSHIPVIYNKSHGITPTNCNSHLFTESTPTSGFRRTPGARRPVSLTKSNSCGRDFLPSGLHRRPLFTGPTFGENPNPVRSMENVVNEIFGFPDVAEADEVNSIEGLVVDGRDGAWEEEVGSASIGGSFRGSDTCSDGGSSGGRKGVCLIVSNLDYNISKQEWEKILSQEFQPHVQLLDINMRTQPDNTSAAFIHVATMDNARYAISHFHRKKIGYKRIHVSLVNDDNEELSAENNLATVRFEVSSLLMGAVNHRLPLYKFMKLYEQRYERTISVSELFQLKDLVDIIDEPEVAESGGNGCGRVVFLRQSIEDTTSSSASSVEPKYYSGDGEDVNLCHDTEDFVSDTRAMNGDASFPDLLDGSVPSSVPSPELRPQPSKLLSQPFDCGLSPSQDFLHLTHEEKKGLATPLCRTPVSDLLQLAMALLPPCEQPCSSLSPGSLLSGIQLTPSQAKQTIPTSEQSHPFSFTTGASSLPACIDIPQCISANRIAAAIPHSSAHAVQSENIMCGTELSDSASGNGQVASVLNKLNGTGFNFQNNKGWLVSECSSWKTECLVDTIKPQSEVSETRGNVGHQQGVGNIIENRGRSSFSQVTKERLYNTEEQPDVADARDPIKHLLWNCAARQSALPNIYFPPIPAVAQHVSTIQEQMKKDAAAATRHGMDMKPQHTTSVKVDNPTEQLPVNDLLQRLDKLSASISKQPSTCVSSPRRAVPSHRSLSSLVKSSTSHSAHINETVDPAVHVSSLTNHLSSFSIDVRHESDSNSCSLLRTPCHNTSEKTKRSRIAARFGLQSTPSTFPFVVQNDVI